MKIKIKNINREIEVSDEEIEDIIIGALEGSIGYWAYLDNDTADFKKITAELKEENPEIAVSEVAAHLILKGDGIKLIDEEDDIEHFVTLAVLEKGMTLYAEKNYGFHPDELDAESYDIIFQLGIFEDIIYG